MSDNAYINDLEERLAEAEKQLTAANATIAALKGKKVIGHTIDGKAVSPGDTVYTREGLGFIVTPRMTIPLATKRYGDWQDVGVEDCYSTPAAAKEAQ